MGKGSLLSFLKARWWATSLSDGVGDEGIYCSSITYIFIKSIHLTDSSVEKGWKHLLTSRSYHFIIPMDDQWLGPLGSGVLADKNGHILHGVIHSNGYGHLLCLNGIEGGSKILKGREIMDLWDRICTSLEARAISLFDDSKKKLMDLRLLHGIAYGHSWFRKWGYNFFRGSFGVTEQQYKEAMDNFASLILDDLVENQDEDLRNTVNWYRHHSEGFLSSIRDLLRFMLTIRRTKITVPAAAANFRNFRDAVSNERTKWNMEQLEAAAKAAVKVLKDHKVGNQYCAMTSNDLKDFVRNEIHNTGLLGFVLKSLHNVRVDNYVVTRKEDPRSREYYYTVHEVLAHVDPQVESSTRVPGNDVYRDVMYLYKFLSGYEPMNTPKKRILGGRHLVKAWPLPRDEIGTYVFTFCLKPGFVDEEGDNSESKGPPCSEIVKVPQHATFGDLKAAIQISMRETYHVTRDFEVTDIGPVKLAIDDQILSGLIKSGEEVWVKGTSLDPTAAYRYQVLPNQRKIKCNCGVEHDDGEPMAQCSICSLWQHKSCMTDMGSNFLCPVCLEDLQEYDSTH